MSVRWHPKPLPHPHGCSFTRHTFHSAVSRVGQNHIYTVCIRYFWQDTHQIYGHIRCIYTVLAKPSNECTPFPLVAPWPFKISSPAPYPHSNAGKAPLSPSPPPCSVTTVANAISQASLTPPLTNLARFKHQPWSPRALHHIHLTYASMYILRVTNHVCLHADSSPSRHQTQSLAHQIELLIAQLPF